MKHNSITCDKCKQTIPNGTHDEIRIMFGKYDKTGHSLDLCSGCMESLRVNLWPKPESKEAQLPWGERLAAMFEEIIDERMPH